MTPLLLAALLVVQDTSAIDRGVRIGIIYRPGVRPGLVVLPRTGGGAGMDSVRAIITRDLDYSDRFEIITLPGGDSIRLAASPASPRASTSRRSSSAGATSRATATATGSLNYPLYQALGADFALDVTRTGDTTLATLHDVAAADVRRTLRATLPLPGSPDFRGA